MIEKGEGDLIVVKRPGLRMPGSMYIPCIHCYGFYLQHAVQLHMRACKDPEGVLKNKKNTLVQCRTMLSKYINPADDEFEHDLNTLLSGLSETTKYPGK